MFEELLESVVPGGAYLAVGLLLGTAFSRQLRPAAKQVVKWGMVAGATMQGAAAEAYERGQDLVAEARYEREQEAQRANGARAAGEAAAERGPARRAPRRGQQAGEA